MTSKTFQEIHLTGEGFRSLATYRAFFKAEYVAALKRRADYDSEVAEWYATGDGASPDWRTEYDDDGNVWNWNAGGKGHTFPHCIHGSSLWTDYDNICGGCEDSQTALEEARGFARERMLRFFARWEWVAQAPGDLDAETSNSLYRWAASLYPGMQS